MRAAESRIVVRDVQHPAYFPDAVWTLEVGELDANADDVSEELRRIVTLDDTLPIPAPFRISTTESQINWGASGSFAQYVIDLSVNYGGAISAAATVSAIKVAFDRIQNRTVQPGQPTPVGSNEARRLIKSHISMHFEVPGDQLIETFSSHSPIGHVHEFSFTGPDGTEYGGRVGSEDDPTRCTKVWRKSGDPRFRPAG